MYVCLCNGITDRQVRQAVDDGAHSLRQVREQLPLGNCCGRCVGAAREIIKDRCAENRCCHLQSAVPA
jgi:bacterioferritin-associated ferredoxin